MALEELQNGRYRFLRLIGSGGMGEVYLMNDTRVSRQVAIKVIRSEGASYPGSQSAKDAARLFEREAKAIAALEHPNILPLYDFGEETNEDITASYMVMPYCPEGSLAGWLRQSSSATLAPQDLAQMVEQAADALQYAHDHQVIHLDVKPSNFLLRGNRKNPNRPTLLLADFGIARSSTTASSSSRTIRGTPTSMAPEQWSSMTIPATDQYALAIMVYEILAGQPPFVGGMEQLMYQHFSVQPPPPSKYNPNLSPTVDQVILRALAKKPEERFPSIAAFASEFEKAMQLLPAGLVLRPQQPNADDSTVEIRSTLTISSTEAIAGTSRTITLPGGLQVKVAVPAGAYHGQVIRLQNLGDSTSAAGELILTIAVKLPEEARQPSNGTSVGPTVLTPLSGGQQPFEPASGSNLPKVAASNPNLRAPEAPQAPQRPFAPAPGHDLPTVASSNPNLRAPEVQQQPPAQKRRRTSPGLIIGIISGLLILLLAGGGVLFYSNYSSQQSANTLDQSQTATAAAQTKHTPTVQISPTPTPPGMYIAGTFNGSMFDATTSQTSSISMKIVQSQGSGVLNGTFTNTSTSQSYTLKGTIDLQGNFHFIVQQPAGQQPRYFYGQIQQQGSDQFMKGFFCSGSTACNSKDSFFTAGPKF
jgi:serine/threonine protein kinase